MTAQEYRNLAHGPGRLGGATLMTLDDAVADCERCRAEDGRNQPDIPVLAGQKRGFLLATLAAYAEGRRASAVMGAAASRLDERTMRAVAEHYAQLPARLSASISNPDPDAELQETALSGELARVRVIVERGLPERKQLPAMATSMSTDGAGSGAPGEREAGTP
jgi:cytochrome c553